MKEPLAPKQLLIVEDAKMVGLHLKKSLEYAGYGVVGTVTNGHDALEQSRKFSPDLILMDIMLEGKMDGIETATQIRREQDIPIIYLTALSDVETIERAKITDPFGYVMKPFNERELLTNIEMVLHKDQVEKQLRASEEKFFAAVTSIPAPLATLDPEGGITYANPFFADMLPQAQGLLGALVTDILNLTPLAEDSQSSDASWWSLLRRDQKLEGAWVLSSQEDQQVYGDFTLVPLQATARSHSGFLLTFRDITTDYRNEQLKKEIERANLAALIEGQEGERTRVARDLHDSLGQMLSGIKLHIETILSKHCDPEHTQPLRLLMDEAIQETTRISENLIPRTLVDLPLRQCVQSLVNNLSPLFDGKIKLEAVGPITDLPQTQKIAIFRITQEALNNAIKYSEAETIHIQMSLEPDRIDLTIEDDGKGFDPSQTQTSFSSHGLKNMKDRASIINGQLSIESSEKLGTLVHLTAPIAPQI
ncbi:MAG: response regulator [Bacteroidota bacterium]